MAERKRPLPQKFNFYDRVTELVRESGHPDPLNATKDERFQIATRYLLRLPMSEIKRRREEERKKKNG